MEPTVSLVVFELDTLSTELHLHRTLCGRKALLTLRSSSCLPQKTVVPCVLAVCSNSAHTKPDDAKLSVENQSCGEGTNEVNLFPGCVNS